MRLPERPVREIDAEVFGGEREISRFAAYCERDPEHMPLYGIPHILFVVIMSGINNF